MVSHGLSLLAPTVAMDCASIERGYAKGQPYNQQEKRTQVSWKDFRKLYSIKLFVRRTIDCWFKQLAYVVRKDGCKKKWDAIYFSQVFGVLLQKFD